MREVVVDVFVRPGLERGVVLAVLVVLGDGADGHADVLHDLEAEELCVGSQWWCDEG